MSQQTVIRNQAKTQRGEKPKKLVLGIFLGEKGRGKIGKMGENPQKEKNEKELGRTDGRFEISRSKSPYPQILVPNGPL